MHVVILNYHYGSEFKTAEDLLNRYYSLTGWAEAVAGTNVKVTVVQRFCKNAFLNRNGVNYQFFADNHSNSLNPWEIPFQLHQRIKAMQPAVLHINGLQFAVQAYALRQILPQLCGIVIQHHAEGPWRKWRRFIQKWALKPIDGFLFTAWELGQFWVEKGVINSINKIYIIMEGTTSFKIQNRKSARAQTGLMGDPVFLWVGRLDSNKDPLTVLSGFERALSHLPKAQLYMIYYSNEDLLPQVKAKISASPLLNNSVKLIDYRPYQTMESYYNSADYFILGSHHEGSGFALMEALACGLVPIVTDIPTFRMMTDNGRIGGLWPSGNAQAFTDTILKITADSIDRQSHAAHRFFENNFSFSAIGRQAVEIYRRVTVGRKR